MTWRPLYAPPGPDPGAHIVARTRGNIRLEACGEWTSSADGRLVDPWGESVMLPSDPEYLAVDLDPRPVLTHLAVRAWFAAESERLAKEGKAYELQPGGVGRLWELMEENSVGLDDVELALWKSTMELERWREMKGTGWIKVQYERDRDGLYRSWFARARL